MTTIECLIESGLFTPEEANELAILMGKLPSGEIELLKLIAALLIQQS